MQGSINGTLKIANMRLDIPFISLKAHPHPGLDVLSVPDGKVDDSLGVHDISGPVVLVSGIRHSGPYPADHDMVATL